MNHFRVMYLSLQPFFVNIEATVAVARGNFSHRLKKHDNNNCKLCKLI